MVYKKRLEFGFNGCGTLMVPRAPRSMRRKKSGEEERHCSFELLASVAGKLLQESEGFASSNAAEVKINLHEVENEKEIHTICKTDRGSCNESVFVPETFIQEHNLLPSIKGVHQSDTNFEMKLGGKEGRSSNANDISSGVRHSSIDEQLCIKLEHVPEVHSGDVKDQIGDLTSKDVVEELVNNNPNVSSESSVNLPLYRKKFPCDLLQKHWNNVKVGIADDDENFSGNKIHSFRRTFRSQSRIGNHRVRKMMTSRYWKTTPGLKDCEKLDTITSEGANPFYRCRKTVYSRERFQQAPIKKRRLSDHRFTVTYDCKDNSNRISNIPGKVAVSIKSFKVPELYIEVPESATLGSLKRTVLEAVTAILGRGIRVGIVFHGKNVRDDNRTLLQAGISQCSNLDNLGFTLEPSLAHISSNPKPVPLANCKQDSVANNELMPIDAAVPHNMALVPVSANPLTAVPLNQKPNRSKVAQRRTRRPFSVAEVESLVEAVEKLGTGRWRDIKICAFENADHRTYVDLKDKWKTLVHTASISPQQRRGEPVPHKLLNRVLSARSYWSRHQSKQGKLQAIEPPRIIMDSQEASVEAP